MQGLKPPLNRWEDLTATATGRTRGALGLSGGLLLHFSDDPLVLRGRSGDRIQSVVSHQLTADVAVTLALTGWLDLGLGLPVVLSQGGASTALVPGISASEAGAGVGDGRVALKLRILGDRGPGAALAVQIGSHLPMGSSADYQGEPTRVEGGLAYSYAWANKTTLAVNGGYRLREGVTLAGHEVDDEITWAVGLALPLSASVSVVPEIFGAVAVLAEEIEADEVPVEGLTTLRIQISEGARLDLGGGLGIVRGAGSPDWRAFAGFAFRSDRAPAGPAPSPTDLDGDGRPDAADQCPEDPEDMDGFEDEDGCPDADNDSDGRPDAVDQCPLDPEDVDGFEDEDGCPDADNDGDGRPDAADQCPLDPEDMDGFRDDDGCPDADNDGDGVPDAVDQCPLEPETKNGVDDADGCPDSKLVRVTCTELRIEEKIYFGTGSATIKKVSFGLLDEVASVMQQIPSISGAQIQGHTDDRGSDIANGKLSQRRAESVRAYLVAQGVEPARLTAQGYGELRPIDTNDTKEGRARNRRVQFVITERVLPASCR